MDEKKITIIGIAGGTGSGTATLEAGLGGYRGGGDGLGAWIVVVVGQAKERTRGRDAYLARGEATASDSGG